MTARWSFAPVCGFDFWRVIVTSPEVLIFLFFMITDPKTVPAGRVGRVAFGLPRRGGQHAADGAADDRVRDQGRAARGARRDVRGSLSVGTLLPGRALGRRTDRVPSWPGSPRWVNMAAARLTRVHARRDRRGDRLFLVTGIVAAGAPSREAPQVVQARRSLR